MAKIKDESMKPYKLWENVTGTPWAEAKAQGLTDGSSEKNVELKQRLLLGEFGQPAVEEQEINNNVTIENSQNMTTSKLWENVTGTPWKTAKDKNLTDSSREKNLDLRNQLLAGEYGEIDIINPPQKEEDTSIDQVDIDEFSEEAGANKIVEVDGRKMVANRRGEPVHLTRNDLQATGLHIGNTLKRIAEQNKQLESPYVDKNVVKLEPEWKLWGDVKEKNKDINKMEQAELVTAFKTNQGGDEDYVVVDKKKGLIQLYNSNSSEPISSSAIDFGAVVGDGQTNTVVELGNIETLYAIQEQLGLEVDGIYGDETKEAIEDYNEEHSRKIHFTPKPVVNWDRGNKNTGAGKFVISNAYPNNYGGAPTFNMMNERQYSNYNKTGEIESVGTTIHAGYIDDDENRVSNGCIRCNKATLEQLYKTISPGTEVYVLPEDDGNAFVLENGQLNFRVGSGKDYDHYRPASQVPFIADEEKGQGINSTINTLNAVPIKVEDKFTETDFKKFAYDNSAVFDGSITGSYDTFNSNRKQITKAVTVNKANLMKKLGINGDVYNEIAKISTGIPMAETKYGTHQKYQIKSNFQGGVSALKSYRGNNSANSIGINQIKYDALVQSPRIEKLFNEFGITKDKLDPKYGLNAYYSTMASVILLADMYRNELKGKDLLTESGVEWQDALLYLYQGKRSELKNKTATPDKNIYINDVKEGSRGFEIYQLD